MEKVPEEVPEVEFRKKNGIVWVLALALMTQTIQVRECNYTLQILTYVRGANGIMPFAPLSCELSSVVLFIGFRMVVSRIKRNFADETPCIY